MTIAVTHAAEGLDRRAFTIRDLELMVEAGIIAHDERLELIGGEIVPMSPKGSRHETIKAAIIARWGQLRPHGYMFVPETGLRLNDRTYLEPDFIVFESRAKRLADVKGPDILLAAEVADSSLNYDLLRKPLVYASFGVKELWVIDAAKRIVHRRTEPRDGRYTIEDKHDAAMHLIPRYAPKEFGFALDDLEDV